MTAPQHPAVFPASLGRRVGAYAIDLAVMSGVATVLVGIFAAVLWAGALARDTSGMFLWGMLGWLLILLGMLGWWVVYSAMQGGRGSIGQRALGLRLQDAESFEPIGFWRAVLRNLVFNLTGSIVIGYFTPLFDSSPWRQGWHDSAVKAVVIDARATDAARGLGPAGAAAAHPGAPAAAMPLHASPGMPAYAAAPFASPAAPATAYVPAASPAYPPAAAPQAHAPAAAPRPYAPAAAPQGYIPAPPAYTPAAPGPAVYAPPSLPPRPAELPSASVIAPHAAQPAHESPPHPAPTATMPYPPAHTTEPLDAAAARRSATAPTAPTATVTRAAPVDADIDETRAAVPARSVPHAVPASPTPSALAVLTWDDGTRMAAYGRTLYGRNPAGEQGAAVMAVRDETLSLSKTHFEIGADANGAWVRDRHSTNGTVLVRDGARFPLVPGLPTTVHPGDRLEFGDRSATVDAV
jgi:uncharacterized RDD family membrane protein YckC